MIRTALLALLLLITPSLAHNHDHVAQTAGLRATHAWTNATNAQTALVFVEIENTGPDTATLLGVETPIATSARLVALENVNGHLRHTPIPHLPIAASTKAVFAPHGLAIELTGLSRSLDEGGHFELTLLFEGAGLEVTVAVESASATRHSHAGHAH